MCPSPAEPHEACPSRGAILYAASGETPIDESDVVARSHLQHCGACQQIVRKAQANHEKIAEILRTPPWWKQVPVSWPHWTMRMRIYYVTLIVPRLLLGSLRLWGFQWRHDIAYGVRAVRKCRAQRRNTFAGLARMSFPNDEDAAAEETAKAERKARFMAKLRRGRDASDRTERLLAACTATRRSARRSRRDDSE